ncbi:Vi polysaccharide export inner membrane protein VexD [Tritonibacter multivorans]|uniref:Vi polysaccharide export inner membrane protein VexD n=1 Tax=Tritonibacter multivorans TaxID=928856 RepID=A0A0P1GG93_9RHOB|nr:Vi polysaccharide export inner membrane protein VexD [Tritonibacter multivorans]SFD55687.1 capsular polysaccharide transport system permease protein [Tritonibacter multivorans]
MESQSALTAKPAPDSTAGGETPRQKTTKNRKGKGKAPPRPPVKGQSRAKAKQRATRLAARAKEQAAQKETKPAAKPAPKSPPKPTPKQALKPDSKAPHKDPIYAPARQARAKKRHWLLLWSFLLCVLIPAGLSGVYLWERAVDQYKSSLGFTVRREEAPSAVDILGGLTNLSSASSSDSDILFEFIQSQELVEKVHARMDLQSVYSRYYDQDPLFSLAPDSAIEDLLAYWQRMVQISYAPGTGLIELKVLAFTPEEARAIAQMIFEESSKMINTLSAIAREDAMRYAREELDQAVEQLKVARQSLTAFRSRTQIVDPSADIQLQMGLLTTLQQQLGSELINYDLLVTNTQANDPRLQQTEQRISALRARIRQEREKFGGGGVAADGDNYATLVAEFERLSVDREFAEQKYAGALQNYDAAQAEAQRQSRYLAAYLNPTLAQSAEYPRRVLIFGLVCLFLLISWATLALIYYSLRDRR